MTGSAPGGFDDIDETVAEEWVRKTTPYERIREVISHQYTAVPACEIADTARTTPKKARMHLKTLADEGFVTTSTGEHGGAMYQRSPVSLVVEQAADIRENVPKDELETRVTEMRDQISNFQDEHGVGSPEELVVNRTNQTLSGVEPRGDIDRETIREWQSTRRNLAFAEAALSISDAEQFVGRNR